MGERNTGTRYLQQLLQLNLPVPHLQLRLDGGKALNSMTEAQKDVAYADNPYFYGWKHACAPTRLQLALMMNYDQVDGSEEHPQQQQQQQIPANRVLFVVTGKNPYSWLLSMWRHPYHYTVSQNG